MKTVVMNVSDVRSSAVDRVALIPSDNTVIVRFANSGTWYEKQVDPTLMVMAMERFTADKGSFGKWANLAGLFSEMTRTSLARVLA